jgi:hypothetical protein
MWCSNANLIDCTANVACCAHHVPAWTDDTANPRKPACQLHRDTPAFQHSQIPGIEDSRRGRDPSAVAAADAAENSRWGDLTGRPERTTDY